MWSEGSIAVPNGDGTFTVCKYSVKHFDEPSAEYGIDGGRISKLTIKVNGETTLNHERGWSVEPEDEASQLAYAILLRAYN